MQAVLGRREGGEVGVLHAAGPGAQIGLRLGDAVAGAGGGGGALLAEVGGGVVAPAAAEHRLGGAQELGEELALPAVEHARPHGPDIRNGQGQEHAQPLGVLHQAREGGDGGGIGEVTLLGEVAHVQVVPHEPADQLHPFGREAEAPAGGGRGLFAGHLLALRPALAGVVQQHGQEEDLAVGDERQDGAQDVDGLRRGRGRVGQDADGAQGVLVHRVGVVHVELHLADDAPELRDEAAEHAAVVHQGQGLLGAPPVGQDVEEHLGRVGIFAQAGGDAVRGLADHRGEGVRMQVQVPLVGDAEDAEQVDRIFLEGGRGRVQPAALLEEAGLQRLLAGAARRPGRKRERPVGRRLASSFSSLAQNTRVSTPTSRAIRK